MSLLLLLLIIIVLLLVTTSRSDDEHRCCQMDTLKGFIDLTSLAEFTYKIDPLIDAGHTGEIRLCKPLEAPNLCSVETKTSGPTNMKNEYSTPPSDGASCWYIGGLSNCSIGSWKAEDQAFKISYPGVPDEEGFTRSLELEVTCDTSATGRGQLDRCERTTPSPSSVIFTCYLSSYFACPGSEPDMWFFNYILGVGGILLIILFVLVLIYLFAGCGYFGFDRFIRKNNTSIELLILGFPIWKYLVLLVLDGVLFLTDFCRKKGSAPIHVGKDGYGEVDAEGTEEYDGL